MEKVLQRIVDESDIRRLLADYCRGCDRVDALRMAGVYAESSWDDHGMVQASGVDFTRQMTGIILANTETLSHLLGQSFFSFEGDEAGVETYFLAVTRWTDDGTAMCSQLGGRYLDRLVREHGSWRITRRITVRDWSVDIPVAADSFATRGLKPGLRTDNDLSFATLGQSHGGNVIP